MRAAKTVNGEKYTYQYLNGKLIHETRGEKSFHYYYDANGCFTAIKYRLTPDGQDYAYYASHNWRGDVVGLYNGNGELVAKYDYDTWGKVKSVKDASGNGIIDQNHVGNLNPFRYRGYYYDKETQLYYLMSRYYDPVTHRFLNADGYFQAGGGLLNTNMGTYCANNPVNSFDPSGTCWIPTYSACGAQMGSYWKTMGNVPGVWYCCKKCGKNDPSYIPQISSETIDPSSPPPSNTGYRPPKKQKGKNQKVPNQNGHGGHGWLDYKGRVWVPDKKMDGGEGWVVQYPDGGHHHEYPNGKDRYHKWDYNFDAGKTSSGTRFPIDYDFSKSNSYYGSDFNSIDNGIIGGGIAIGAGSAWSLVW